MDFEHEGIYEELVKRFEKMVQNDAFEFFDTEEYQDIVVYYIEKDNLFMAKKALDYALHQYPMELDILVIQAEIFIVEGKFDTALELLNQLEQKDDKHYEVLYQKGVAYSRKGKHRQAIDYFFRASSQTIEKDEAFHQCRDRIYLFTGISSCNGVFSKSIEIPAVGNGSIAKFIVLL
ncbi:tetratricopeptide repeat protein [Capnocytophaga sp. ARDL2]|uniref:tetratricopeptide repeat protein n=1 Tax=Capnocytophaga sp. ARDL2 TaxID=3238809 RepID=UPI0035583A1E